MARWTAYFPEGFVGLTGTPGSVRQVADRYGIKYARVETTSKGGYTMSHTADQYLIDGSGQLRAAYPFGTTSADILADIARLPGG
jgi:protein SCO1/2